MTIRTKNIFLEIGVVIVVAIFISSVSSWAQAPPATEAQKLGVEYNRLQAELDTINRKLAIEKRMREIAVEFRKLEMEERAAKEEKPKEKPPEKKK